MASIASATAAPVLALSPGRVALRRTLRHGSFWVGGGILLVILVAAIFAPLLTAARPDLAGSRQAARAAGVGRARLLGASARHRSARPRLSRPADLWRADLASHRLRDRAHLRRDRNGARDRCRLLGRPRRSPHQLRPDHPPDLAGGAGRARRRRARGNSLTDPHAGDRPSVVGPFRDRDPKRDPADREPRVHRRGAGDRQLDRAHPASRRSCRTSPDR